MEEQNLPLTVAESLPFPTLPLFLAMFFAVYLIGYFVVFRNWSPNRRPEASSCFISLAHGTPAAFLAVCAVASDQDRGFAAPNTATQSTVIDYSVAYFLTDLLHYCLFFSAGDLLFILHHIATLFAFLTCQYVARRGAFAILVLLALAEATSLFQNLWTLARSRRADHAFAARAYRLLSPSFYAYYTIVRGFGAPWFAYQMGAAYFGGEVDGVIPTWVWGSWLFLVVLFIPVSLLWIANLWMELYRERSDKVVDKLN